MAGLIVGSSILSVVFNWFRISYGLKVGGEMGEYLGLLVPLF